MQPFPNGIQCVEVWLSRRDETVQEMGRRKASAIIRTQDEGLARDAMKAAVEGGFGMVEFTLTTPNALGLIREFSDRKDLLVGAGTVLTVEDANAAVEAGARFLVSPITDGEVIGRARRLDVPSVPGTFTPTEMVTAQRLGADLVKVFPAPADLPRFVTQVRGPLPELKIFPTAGVDEDNFEAVLKAGAFGVGFVSSLFRPDVLAERRFDAIRDVASKIHARLQRIL